MDTTIDTIFGRVRFADSTSLQLIEDAEETGLSLKIALPGVKKEGISITGQRGKITLEITEASDFIKVGKWVYRVPNDYDPEKTKVSYADGQLSLDVPPAKPGKKLEIN